MRNGARSALAGRGSDTNNPVAIVHEMAVKTPPSRKPWKARNVTKIGDGRLAFDIVRRLCWRAHQELPPNSGGEATKQAITSFGSLAKQSLRPRKTAV
jgi:hypothetical protein